MVLRMAKQYLPMFQPSKQATSDLVRARKSLIFPSSFEPRPTVRTFGVDPSRKTQLTYYVEEPGIGADVLRLIAASVVLDGMPVSISAAPDVAPSLAVPASLLNDVESLTSAVPSARQKTSASSVSTRLHWGQRFIDLYQTHKF